MRTFWIKLIELGLVIAFVVAAKPYLDFLLAASPEQARRWMFTVIALGIAGGLYVARRNLRADRQQP